VFPNLQEIPQNNQSGLDDFYEIEKVFYKFSKDVPITFRVLIHFAQYVKKESKYYTEWLTLKKTLFTIMAGSIVKGQKDKSIRADFDPHGGTFNLIVMMAGYFYLVKETGDVFLKQEDLEKEKLIKLALKVWKDSLKNTCSL
jgi:hypothetical protein